MAALTAAAQQLAGLYATQAVQAAESQLVRFAGEHQPTAGPFFFTCKSFPSCGVVHIGLPVHLSCNAVESSLKLSTKACFLKLVPFPPGFYLDSKTL